MAFFFHHVPPNQEIVAKNTPVRYNMSSSNMVRTSLRMMCFYQKGALSLSLWLVLFFLMWAGDFIIFIFKSQSPSTLTIAWNHKKQRCKVQKQMHRTSSNKKTAGPEPTQVPSNSNEANSTIGITWICCFCYANCKLKRTYICRYLEPKWPLFWMKSGPSFGGFKPKNIGQPGSR